MRVCVIFADFVKVEIGSMSLLAPSPWLGSVLERSSRAVKPPTLRIGGYGGVALWPSWSRIQIGDGHRPRVFSLSGRSATDVEGAGYGVEGEGEGEGEGERVVSSSTGWGAVVRSCLSNSATVGMLAFVAATMVSRTRRPGYVATTAESGQVYVLDGDAQVGKVMRPISQTKASRRSLCFASTTLSPEGLTKLEEKKIDGARQEFVEWVDSVRRDAQSEGVSEGVMEWAFEDMTVSKESVVHRKTAPEVKLTVDDYLKRMVDERRVSIGASRLKENTELLAEVSQKFWRSFSVFGVHMGHRNELWILHGKLDIIQSLATMGFTEELAARRKYFRGELIEALVMLEKGNVERGAGPQGEKRLRGSWAGAMGQCQFMPTSFRDYAFDFDGDGRKDIWESKPDVFASIANYFKEHGWKEGGPIFQKVQVPRKLDKSLVGLGVVKSVLDWEHKHGVHLNPGRAPALPPDEMASLVMPNGPKGDAYLVCNNFRVILRYNASTLYGFAVCELARQIQERASNPFPTQPLLS